jgi:hypothetical protein
MEEVFIRFTIEIIFLLISIIWFTTIVIKHRRYIKDFIMFRRIDLFKGKEIYWIRAVFITWFIINIMITPLIFDYFKDIKFFINKEYSLVRGKVVHQDKGKRNTNMKRYLHVKNLDTGKKEEEIIVYTNFIEEGEYFEVKFLPNSRRGIIIKRIK